MQAPSYWLYRLRLVDPAKLTSGFSDADQQAMVRHRQYLNELTAAGTCIIAGRTDAGEQTFGVVVISAFDQDVAHALMNGDPAVREGLMTAELFPFFLAFLAKNDTPIL